MYAYRTFISEQLGHDIFLEDFSSFYECLDCLSNYADCMIDFQVHFKLLLSFNN